MGLSSELNLGGKKTGVKGFAGNCEGSTSHGEILIELVSVLGMVNRVLPLKGRCHQYFTCMPAKVLR